MVAGPETEMQKAVLPYRLVVERGKQGNTRIMTPQGSNPKWDGHQAQQEVEKASETPHKPVKAPRTNVADPPHPQNSLKEGTSPPFPQHHRARSRPCLSTMADLGRYQRPPLLCQVIFITFINLFGAPESLPAVTFQRKYVPGPSPRSEYT